MYVNLNPLMKSYNYKNKKESPSFIFNSKLSEINDISEIFTTDKKNNLQSSIKPVNKSLNLKLNHKSKKPECKNISIEDNSQNKTSKKNQSPFHLFKTSTKTLLLKKSSLKKNNLRKIIFDKSNIKIFKKYNKNNKEKSKSFMSNKRNLSFNNISISNIGNKNNIEKVKKKEIMNCYNFKLNNAKLSFNKNKIKLFKKPKIKNINNYHILSQKDFYIHFSSLLDNIIRIKENEYEKNNIKTTNNKQLIEKVYKNLNLFNRKKKKIKKFNPDLHEYNRDNTTSIENKKNIPFLYNNYLNKTKKTFNNLNNTYCALKNDITYDIIYDKKPKYKKRAFTEKDLKYEELTHEVREIKQDIGYEKPSIELFKNKYTSFQILSGMFDNLNKLNSTIAYKHRYYFAKKYGIDIKKELLKIEDENEDYLYKFQKTIPK